MRNIFLVLFVFFSLISCKQVSTTQPQVKDSLVGREDSVSLPEVKDSLIVPEVHDVFEDLFKIAETVYTVKKLENDSIITVNKKLNFELDQHIKNQADAKAYVNKAMSNKANDKYLKGWMVSTINKHVKKFDGVYVGETLKVDSTLSNEKKYNILLNEKNRLDSLNSVYIEKNKSDAKQLLHKKFVTTNAQFYLNITIKNPSQDKFLKGWMRRALSQ